ncbi:hypothetical protein FACS189413_11160 [Bacteroidia bacterium]|nr:hypothetical protein FACS189413_11160 [Bacteroidia bacterium]
MNKTAYIKHLQAEANQKICTHNSNFTKIGNYIKNKAPELIPEIALHLENMKKLYTKFFPE